MTDLNQNIFTAKTFHVRHPELVDFQISIGRFRLTLTQLIRLRGFTLEKEELIPNAKHCLVVLLGGKKVTLEMDYACQKEPWLSFVYLRGEIHGVADCNIQIGDEPHIHVCNYMNWLQANNGFDVNVVRSQLNGR